MADPIELGPHTNMTVDEAIGCSSRMDFREVLIIGYNQNGTFMSVSSSMSSQSALWLSVLSQKWALNSDEED